MKKLLLAVLSVVLLLLSCSPEKKTYTKYKKFHVKNTSDSSNHDVARKEKKSFSKQNELSAFVTPQRKGDKKYSPAEIRQNNLSSIKSQNYGKIEENSDLVFVNSDFDDFSEIYQNGRYVGQYKVGNPYEIEGVPYYPQEYDDYEEVGVASWYGEDFHGKKTANGEIYNLDSMTAAHQTLPLPSIVKVTNLENGRSVMVRVNDRGPFAKNRIIDLSKKAAEKLEYKDRGTTTVKVEYMSDETANLLKALGIRR